MSFLVVAFHICGCFFLIKKYSSKTKKDGLDRPERLEIFQSIHSTYPVLHLVFYSLSMKIKIPITTNALCVDASCSGNPGPMEYRAVDLKAWKEVFHSPIYPTGTNNIGEFLAIYDGIRHIEKLEKKKSKKNYECIFTDSETAIARMKSKKIKTTLKYTPETKELLTKLQEALTRIKTHDFTIPIRKRETEIRWEIPADFDRK